MDTQWWISILLGFALGAKHALEPDHIVAVGTLMHGEARVGRLVRLGALWGAGHFSTLAIGVGVLTALRISLSAHQIVFFEAPVAAMLVGLGLLAIKRSPAAALSVVGTSTSPDSGINAPRPAWWSYMIGSVHGLAGTGALVIFAAATFPNLAMTLQYVVVFGVGAMVGMALITGMLAGPMHALQRRPKLYRNITAGTGALSVLLGLSIFVELYHLLPLR